MYVMYYMMHASRSSFESLMDWSHGGANDAAIKWLSVTISAGRRDGRLLAISVGR